jgi:hypothetical protein
MSFLNTFRDADEIDMILNGCLELVRRGAGNIENIVERYPDIQDILKPPLEAASWLVLYRRIFDPRPGFAVRSRSKILCRIRSKTLISLPPGRKHARLRELILSKRAFESWIVLIGGNPKAIM